MITESRGGNCMLLIKKLPTPCTHSSSQGNYLEGGRRQDKPVFSVMACVLLKPFGPGPEEPWRRGQPRTGSRWHAAKDTQRPAVLVSGTGRGAVAQIPCQVNVTVCVGPGSSDTWSLLLTSLQGRWGGSCRSVSGPGRCSVQQVCMFCVFGALEKVL